jgi:acetyl-CoA carboxylase carboxyltransferase component
VISSGVVPQLSIIAGHAQAVQCIRRHDRLYLHGQGHVADVITGPEVIKSVTGERSASKSVAAR